MRVLTAKLFGVLVAAVQHHHQRQLLAELHARRPIEAKAARTVQAHGDAGDPVAFAARRAALGGSRLDGLRHCLVDGPLPHAQVAAREVGEAALEGLGPDGGVAALGHAALPSAHAELIEEERELVGLLLDLAGERGADAVPGVRRSRAAAPAGRWGCAACSRAVILRDIQGSTRGSFAPVMNSTAG